MKENHRYIDYADYNIWANDRLINDLKNHSDNVLDHEFVSSFPTIRATIKHIWYAETGWLARLTGNGWAISEVENFSGTTAELYSAWQNTSELFRQYVAQENLDEGVPFEHKGEQFSIPRREIAQTVFNHGSYHRGQVVMMMRQLEITDITQTDYIEWVREKARGNI